MKIKSLLGVLLLSSTLMPLAYGQEQTSNIVAGSNIQSPPPVGEMTFGAKRLAKKLMKATVWNKHAEMRELFDKGADPNLPVKGDSAHYTPLGKCLSHISYCRKETINLLIEKGADTRRLRAASFQVGSEWSPASEVIETAINQSIDRTDYERFQLLSLTFADHKYSSVEHMKLYNCYAHYIHSACGKGNSTWPKQLEKARWHLERAVESFDGETYDGNFYAASDPRYRLAEEVLQSLTTWARQSGHEDSKAAWPIWDAVAYCERAVEWYKPESELRHQSACSNEGVFFYCSDGSGNNPKSGSGYSNMRSLLDHCLSHTKDHESWERLLVTRGDYFSLRDDVRGGKVWILSHAEEHYRKRNRLDIAENFAKMRVAAVAEAAELKKSNWDPSRQFYAERAGRWLDAQAQQERDNKIAGQRRRKELQELSAQSHREQEKAWANSKSQDNEFWGNIKKTERQTMDNINANSSRMQKSRASSTSSSNGSPSSQDRQEQSQNSQANNDSNKKEQCPYRPLGDFNPNATAISDEESMAANKRDYTKWFDSLSPYCKSQSTKPENLYKGGSGSGVSK